MKTILGLAASVFLVLLAAGAEPEPPIDFEKARGYLQRERTGQPPLTPEERAYLERAKQARARGGESKGGESKGGGAPRSTSPSTGMVPLTEAKTAYHGESGGLYGDGANEPPAALAKAAAKAAAQIKPLDASGKPSAQGKIVLLSIGMSNTTQEFTAFQALSDKAGNRSKAVVLVDGAQGGQSADRIVDPSANFWKVVDQRLEKAGATRAQVQAIWFKQAFPGPRAPFPEEAKRLQGYVAQDLAVIRKNYANLRLVFLSSRIYAGYATSALNPEPHAYESAFAVRWTILEQLKSGGIKETDPVLVWGPYLWADGVKGRAMDELVWKAEDFGPDGTHPGESGRRKVAEQLEKFLTTSPFAKGWYLK